MWTLEKHHIYLYTYVCIWNRKTLAQKRINQYHTIYIYIYIYKVYKYTKELHVIMLTAKTLITRCDGKKRAKQLQNNDGNIEHKTACLSKFINRVRRCRLNRKYLLSPTVV